MVTDKTSNNQLLKESERESKTREEIDCKLSRSKEGKEDQILTNKAPTTLALSLRLKKAKTYLKHVDQLIDILVSGPNGKEPMEPSSVNHKWRRMGRPKVCKI